MQRYIRSSSNRRITLTVFEIFFFPSISMVKDLQIYYNLVVKRTPGPWKLWKHLDLKNTVISLVLLQVFTSPERNLAKPIKRLGSWWYIEICPKTLRKVTITDAENQFHCTRKRKAASLVSKRIFCHCGKWIQIQKGVILHVQIGIFCPFLSRNP